MKKLEETTLRQINVSFGVFNYSGSLSMLEETIKVLDNNLMPLLCKGNIDFVKTQRDLVNGNVYNGGEVI